MKLQEMRKALKRGIEKVPKNNPAMYTPMFDRGCCMIGTLFVGSSGGFLGRKKPKGRPSGGEMREFLSKTYDIPWQTVNELEGFYMNKSETSSRRMVLSLMEWPENRLQCFDEFFKLQEKEEHPEEEEEEIVVTPVPEEEETPAEEEEPALV